MTLEEILVEDEARALERKTYRKNPVLFVQKELGQTPSEDQADFLRSCANLDNYYHVVAAGRGGGKTRCMAWLVAWSIAVLPEVFNGYYECIILGGSAEQSRIVYNYFKKYIYMTPLLQNKLEGEIGRAHV